jgi:hypothetical protein
MELVVLALSAARRISVAAAPKVAVVDVAF